jgi:FKBP-type peptidyl-prolyl cis-trans isomerase FkpA
MITKKVFYIVCLLVLAAGCSDKTVELTFQEQLQKDIGIIDKWLADNAITALSDPSGLRYSITLEGTGPRPALTNKVTVTYTGKFLKEGVNPGKSEVFDQAITAVTFDLASLIAGWQIGFQLLPKGSKATLYIPSGLAYGKNGAGNSIPGNSNLFFEVELIDVK